MTCERPHCQFNHPKISPAPTPSEDIQITEPFADNSKFTFALTSGIRNHLIVSFKS
jgi:hypothetical protein